MLKAGNITNKGVIEWVDNPSPLISDPLVKTNKGLFRLSEIIPITKEQYLIQGRWVDKVWFPNLVEQKRTVILTI